MDFHGMKRKELQSLCKKHGIPANLTNREMAGRLDLVLKVLSFSLSLYIYMFLLNNQNITQDNTKCRRSSRQEKIFNSVFCFVLMRSFNYAIIASSYVLSFKICSRKMKSP